MNVFELTIVASPLSGAIVGGRSVDSPGALPVVAGVATGFLIGVSVWFAAVGLIVVSVRAFGLARADEKLNAIQWAASMTSVLAVAASPLISGMTAGIVSRILL